MGDPWFSPRNWLRRLGDRTRSCHPTQSRKSYDERRRGSIPILPEQNRLFHRLLIDGVPIEYASAQGEKVADQARLVDFESPAANDLLVVNQFVVQGTKCLRRPDLVVFVNGLPLAVIELKNPADHNADVWKAFHQLQTYKDEISDLFIYNTALVVSDGVTARVGSLTASPEWFMPWRTINGSDDKPALQFELEKIVGGFFRPDLLGQGSGCEKKGVPLRG